MTDISDPDRDLDPGPDPARARFFILGLLRLGGVALAFLGISIIAKRWVEPAEIIGGAALLAAVFVVMILPFLLVKRWRTPPTP